MADVVGNVVAAGFSKWGNYGSQPGLLHSELCLGRIKERVQIQIIFYQFLNTVNLTLYLNVRNDTLTSEP
jgi:hypothetical protein